MPDQLSTPESTTPETTPDGYTTVALQLRYGDMDTNHHINNVQIARLCEEVRVRSFAQWFDQEGRPEGFSMVVGRQDIVFRSVLHYSIDPITGRSCIGRIGTSSFTMVLTLIDADGTTCAVAETTMVSFDPVSGRSQPIPPAVRDVIETHLVEGAGLPARL
ncbi:acyl-CoA thioesterase [Gordonia sp. NPDC003424]